jgi:hypothetical protein
MDHRTKAILHAKMKEWVSDEDTWVGVFENHDLGHHAIGQRCVFPFALSDGSMDKAEVGKTRAPDGKTIGLGWRYILIHKTTSPDEAIKWLAGEEK